MSNPFRVTLNSSPQDGHETSSDNGGGPEASGSRGDAGGHAESNVGHGGDGHGEHEHGPEISAEDWTVDNSMDWYLSSDHLIAHVQDQTFFEIPFPPFKEPYHLEIPNPLGFTDAEPMVAVEDNEFLGPVTFQPTKFIVLELVAAILVAGMFIALGRKMQSGQPVKGRFWNMLEAGCVFVRDEIARPSIGTKDATRFLPLIWTVFFFVLAMNLIGMVPGLGAATGSISITASLALVVFAIVLYTGMKKMGVAGFWKAQAPHIELSGPLKYILIPMIWAIEVFGLFIKHLVLAVRLFANMFAGHLVLAVFVAFVGVAWNTALAYGVIPGVIGASLGVNLLELLVAFIQAYVFAFLTALFIGAAIHPH
jgi:F-type H+-transporting ATPase subunit a